jgi:hypothetical protein
VAEEDSVPDDVTVVIAGHDLLGPVSTEIFEGVDKFVD